MESARGLNVVKEFKKESVFQLVELDSLPEEEKLAVMEAYAEQKRSKNPEFPAGAAAVAEDGTRVAKHNEYAGREGHAEQLAITALFRAVKLSPSERKLKMVALAASNPHTGVVHEEQPYDEDSTLSDVTWAKPCGHCLKFISDYAGNLLSEETGKDDLSKDVTILSLTATGQVMRTSLRSLLPAPHIPTQVSLRALDQNITRSPDTYGNGK